MAKQPTNPIVLGKLGSSYSIRGWLRLFSSTDIAEHIFNYQPWFIRLNGEWKLVEIEDWRRHNKELIVKLNGIDNRDEANKLTNCEIIVAGEQLPALEAGDYYWKDLIGCHVVTTDHYDLGIVTAMMETGSNDVLVVRANRKDAFGATERLIPFIDNQVIKKVDLTTHSIEVDWDPSF